MPKRLDVEITYQSIQNRWPRLVSAIQWVACLSIGEAAACIRDYLEGREFSGEAVNHFGGTKQVLEAAIRPYSRQAARSRRQEYARWEAKLRAEAEKD